MSFLSATRFGKKLCLSYHKVNEIVHGDENRHSYCHIFDYGAFEGVTTVADVDQLTVKTMTLTNELHKEAIKVDAARANLAYAVIESALIWLRKTIH